MKKLIKNQLIMKYPSSWWGAKWRDALPSGNGTIGASVYGAVHDETVLLTHEDLWHGAITPELPDVSELLPEVRRLLDEGDVQAADRLLAGELRSRGYKPEMGNPLPLADLKIKMPVRKGFREYRRALNMETGEVAVTWTDGDTSYRRSLFVSRPDNFVVMEITSSAPSLVAEIALDLHDRSDTRSVRGKISALPINLEVEADESGWIRYAAHNDDGTDFGAVARVLPCSSSAVPPCVIAKDGSLHIKGAERVLVVVKLFVQGKRRSAWRELMHDLDNVRIDYQALLAPHIAEHGELFARVALDLGGKDRDHELSNEEILLDAYQGEASTALVEKMWAYGRYLLISSSRPGGQPCPLHGKWSGSYRGCWAFHMVNENLQMIYWQALSGALGETTLPVFDYFEKLMDDFHENARKLFSCRGIYIPAPTVPASGLLKTISPHIIHWTGGAAWVAQLYYDYYLHTGDLTFLRERALPFLRETALFYEDFFTIDENGFYVSSPSVSPENTPGNHWDGEGMGAAMETTINATMDFALAKEVLTHLLEAAQILELEQSEVETWTKMRDRIPPYQINNDGAVSEWMHPEFRDNYHHRHQSHIYPVFPGLEVRPNSNPELLKAFEIAIEKRLDIGISEQTGWSLAHMANVYARMKRGDEALDCLNLMARSCVTNNFYTTHNDWRNMGVGVDMQWAPFQIDANMGWSAAIQEMLLLSVPGQICVLPALASKWTRGSVKGLVARGGVRVSIDWNFDIEQVLIEMCSVGRAQVVELEIPFATPDKRMVELDADKVKSILVDNIRLRESLADKLA